MADYTRLAALIGTYPETAIFRRFTNMNAKALLYMQSELMHLEAELSHIELENKESGDHDKALFQVSLYDMKNSCGTSKDMQWRKVLEIREKLKTYSRSKPSKSSKSLEVRAEEFNYSLFRR